MSAALPLTVMVVVVVSLVGIGYAVGHHRGYREGFAAARRLDPFYRLTAVFGRVSDTFRELALKISRGDA